MGNICKVPQSMPHGTGYSQSDSPHPLYATQCKEKPVLPIDESILSSVHHQPLIFPGWYSPKHSVMLDSYYLILHFDLYYRGQWRKGMPHGLGQVITKDGQYFKGYFSEGVAKGPQCLFALSAHTYYLGTVDRNQRSGKGKFVDGEYYYEGHWLNNLPHGAGKQTYPNGDTYQGGFHQGVKSGQGTYTWISGHFDSYTGYFRGDQLCGKGNLKIRGGATWDGVFDCEEELNINKCECVAENLAFKGDIKEGNPHEAFTVKDGDTTYKLTFEKGKITGFNQLKEQQVIFRNKVLRFYQPKADPDLIQKIIDQVQSSYKGVRKHSEALEKLKKALPDLSCEFWRADKEVSGLVIVPICGKFIQVSDASRESRT